MASQGPSDVKTQTMASAHLQERRELRYAAVFPIEVTGLHDGEPFSEKTVTDNVSEWGCGFQLSFELQREDLVSIRRLSGDFSLHSLYQVTRATQEDGHWVTGAWKLGAEDMWGAELEKFVAPAAHRELRDEAKGTNGDGQLKDGTP